MTNTIRKSEGEYSLKIMQKLASVAATADGLMIEGNNFKVGALTGCPDMVLFACEEIMQLRARIAELEEFVSDEANQTCNCGYPKVCNTCKDIRYAKELLNKSPTQSLNNIKADAIIEAVNKLENPDVPMAEVMITNYDLVNYANKIRKGGRWSI